MNNQNITPETIEEFDAALVRHYDADGIEIENWESPADWCACCINFDKVKDVVELTREHLEGKWDAAAFINFFTLQDGLDDFFTACGFNDARERAADFRRCVRVSNLRNDNNYAEYMSETLAGMVLEFTRQVMEKGGK